MLGSFEVEAVNPYLKLTYLHKGVCDISVNLLRLCNMCLCPHA